MKINFVILNAKQNVLATALKYMRFASTIWHLTIFNVFSFGPLNSLTIELLWFW